MGPHGDVVFVDLPVLCIVMTEGFPRTVVGVNPKTLLATIPSNSTYSVGEAIFNSCAECPSRRFHRVSHRMWIEGADDFPTSD